MKTQINDILLGMQNCKVCVGEAANKLEYLFNSKIKDLQTKLNTYEIEQGMTMKHVQPHTPYCSRTDALFTHMLEYHGLTLVDTEMNDIIDIVHKNAPLTQEVKGKLSNENIQTIVNWMNTWDQLKGSAIPVRFKEHFSLKQPKPIRTIHFEGKDIPEDEEVYYFDKDTLKIFKDKIVNVICNRRYDGLYYSKLFLLSEKEALNARLKEMVIEEAKKKTFSIEEIGAWDGHFTTIMDYAIELVEKERNIKYLS